MNFIKDNFTKDSFTKEFSEFIHKRTEVIWKDNSGSGNDLKKLEEELGENEEELLTKLENEDHKLVDRQGEIVNKEIDILRQSIYRLGLEDGIKIALGIVERENH